MDQLTVKPVIAVLEVSAPLETAESSKLPSTWTLPDVGLATTEPSCLARLNGVFMDDAGTPVLGRVVLDEEKTLQT